jgi:cysteinyl-tRNA synthetase
MRLSDTFTRGPAELPEPPGPVRIYSCGPTVYQRIHVGNAVPFVFAMWLRRWLQHTGYDVQLAINITDVNDKIYEAAPGESAELARNATEWYLEDTSGLGLGRPDFEPRATGTIPEQVAMIEQLVDAGFAYEVDGDVYYRVSRFSEYGRLSGQRPDKVEEQEPNARKEDPRDFALWKANKPGEDTSWDSPWGNGRPGWHIECSAMSEKHLGTEFEVHGGGLDLVFPHHENELAQSRALGHRYAKIWMHNGLLRFGGAEMHKSLGNTVTLQDALATWGRETLLLFYATGHWRKPLDFTDKTLRSAAARAEGFRDVFRAGSEPAPDGSWERFAAALDDDFNTPEALAVMHEWRDHDLLRRALEIFGLGSLAELPEAPPEVVELARERARARAERRFDDADELRRGIEEAGWIVRDSDAEFQLVPRS